MDHARRIFDVSLIHVSENLNVLLKEERSAAGLCGFIAQTGEVSRHRDTLSWVLMWICSKALWESTAPVELKSEELGM